VLLYWKFLLNSASSMSSCFPKFLLNSASALEAVADKHQQIEFHLHMYYNELTNQYKNKWEGFFFQTTFTAPAPQFSRDIISRDFPFDSGTKEVNSRPKRLIKPSTISEFRTQYQQGIQHLPWLRPGSEPNIRNQMHQLYPQSSLMLLIYGGMQTSTLVGKCQLSQQTWWHWVQNLLNRRLLSASSRIQFGFPCESSGSKGWPKQI